MSETCTHNNNDNDKDNNNNNNKDNNKDNNATRNNNIIIIINILITTVMNNKIIITIIIKLMLFLKSWKLSSEKNQDFCVILVPTLGHKPKLSHKGDDGPKQCQKGRIKVKMMIDKSNSLVPIPFVKDVRYRDIAAAVMTLMMVVVTIMMT